MVTSFGQPGRCPRRLYRPLLQCTRPWWPAVTCQHAKHGSDERQEERSEGVADGQMHLAGAFAGAAVELVAVEEADGTDGRDVLQPQPR